MRTDVTPTKHYALTHMWVCLQPTSGGEFDCDPKSARTQARVITLSVPCVAQRAMVKTAAAMMHCLITQYALPV